MRVVAELARAAAAIAVGAAATAGCASSPVPALTPNGANGKSSAYPGPCSSVELQASERPSPGPGITPPNLGMDTIEVVATYRPSGGSQRKPVSYSSLYQKEQVNDLNAQFTQRPEILCEGESAGNGTNPQGSSAPPVQAQPGPRLPAESP